LDTPSYFILIKVAGFTKICYHTKFKDPNLNGTDVSTSHIGSVVGNLSAGMMLILSFMKISPLMYVILMAVLESEGE
jgi:hypothetical protein